MNESITVEQQKAKLLELIFAHDAAVESGDVAELAVVDSFMESRRLVLESVRLESLEA